MLKNTKDIIFLHFFSDYSYGMRLVPTYILSAKDIRLLGKFHPDSFKTERLVCLETDGQTDMARSTRLVMLIKNIYTLWGRKRLLHCVANFWLKSIYPLQGYKKWLSALIPCLLYLQLPTPKINLSIPFALETSSTATNQKNITVNFRPQQYSW